MSAPNENFDFDIVISGAGLVGSSLAHALKNLDLRVLLLDRGIVAGANEAAFDDRVIALSWSSRQVLAGLGLWTQMSAEAEPIRRVHVSDKGHFGFARLDCQDLGVDALGYVVPARTIGQVLHEDLEHLNGIQLMRPAELVSFNTNADGVQLEIDHAGQHRRLRTALLVAADGDDSLVRAHGGFRSRQWDYEQTAVICNVQTSLPHRNVAYERFAGRGPIAMLPMTGRRCALVWTLCNDEVDDILQLDDAAFAARVQDKFGFRLGRLERVGHRSAYPLQMQMVTRAAQDGVVLLGNAAHTLHPIAGQGFNLGLRDVAVLAEVLDLAARPEFDVDAIAAAYHSGRQKDQWGTTLGTDILVRLFGNPLGMVRHARNAALVATDLLPGARNAIARAGMGLFGRQTRLARGLKLGHE